jgi:hypothetical protein
MDIRKVFDATAAGAAFYDFEWYAADASGQLAVFTSAGLGPIPQSVFSSRDAYVALVSFLENRPLSPMCTLNPNAEGDLWFWAESARRGLFGYDWNAPAGSRTARAPYRWIATPEVSLSVDALPPSIARYVRVICFRGVAFGTDLEIVAEKHFSDLVY